MLSQGPKPIPDEYISLHFQQPTEKNEVASLLQHIVLFS